MKKKTVLCILSVIGIAVMLVGCNKPVVNSSINTSVKINDNPIFSYQNSTGNNKNEEVPHFSSLKVYCGSEDITSKADQEKIEEIIYATITDKKFFEGCLDQMAWELDPDQIPEGKIQIVAEYDPAVTIESTDISKVIITPDDLHEDAYFFIAGCTTFASDLVVNALREACGF